MKKLHKSGHYTLPHNDQLRILKAVRQLIKTKAYKKQAMEMLEGIDLDILPDEGKVLYNYIYGRYHSILYKEENDIEELEIANDFYDEMVAIAYENKVNITDPRMHFARAYVKYQLSQMIWDEERRPYLSEKARHITETTLRFNSNNSSFIWLQGQLSQ